MAPATRADRPSSSPNPHEQHRRLAGQLKDLTSAGQFESAVRGEKGDGWGHAEKPHESKGQQDNDTNEIGGKVDDRAIGTDAVSNHCALPAVGPRGDGSSR